MPQDGEQPQLSAEDVKALYTTGRTSLLVQGHILLNNGVRQVEMLGTAHTDTDISSLNTRSLIEGMNVDEIALLQSAQAQTWTVYTGAFQGKNSEEFQANLIINGVLLAHAAQSSGTENDVRATRRIGEQFAREFDAVRDPVGSGSREDEMRAFLRTAPDSMIAAYASNLYDQASGNGSVNIWRAMVDAGYNDPDVARLAASRAPSPVRDNVQAPGPGPSAFGAETGLRPNDIINLSTLDQFGPPPNGNDTFTLQEVAALRNADDRTYLQRALDDNPDMVRQYGYDPTKWPGQHGCDRVSDFVILPDGERINYGNAQPSIESRFMNPDTEITVAQARVALQEVRSPSFGMQSSLSADILGSRTPNTADDVRIQMLMRGNQPILSVSGAQAAPSPSSQDVPASPAPSAFNSGQLATASAALLAQYPEGHNENTGVDRFLDAFKEGQNGGQPGFLRAPANAALGNALTQAFGDSDFRAQVSGLMDDRGQQGDFSFYFLTEGLQDLTRRAANDDVQAQQDLARLTRDLQDPVRRLQLLGEDGLIRDLAQGNNLRLQSQDTYTQARNALTNDDGTPNTSLTPEAASALNPTLGMAVRFLGVERTLELLDSPDGERMLAMMDEPERARMSASYGRYMARFGEGGGLQSAGDQDQAASLLRFVQAAASNQFGGFDQANFATLFIGDDERGIRPIATLGDYDYMAAQSSQGTAESRAAWEAARLQRDLLLEAEQRPPADQSPTPPPQGPGQLA